MRLHRLRLQAFGPFAGSEEIDFDQLAAAGLHLIHGPTGAGKTSILDAICFALFSGVPGARMSGRDTLRSDHAAPTARPEVELDFGVGDRRLRVRRSPEHLVAKKRGGGTRTQRGSVLLQELRAGRWEEVSTRADEVAQVIGDLLGMGLPQFAQVMLLPQGEFTAFLRAKADDRGRLLERLFDISDFAAVEQWLAEHRKNLETEVARARAERAALVARAQDTLSGIPADDVDGPPLTELDAHESAQALHQLTDRVSGRLTTALAEADAANARVELSRTRLAAQRELAGLQQLGRAARATLQRLAQDAPVVAEAQQRLDLATRAAACRPAVTALRRRREAQRTAHAACTETHAALVRITGWPVPVAHDDVPLADAALAPLLERAAAGTAALAGQAELRRQVQTARDELRAAAAAVADAEQDAARRAELVADGTAELATLIDRRDELRPVAAADPQWQALVADLGAATAAITTTIRELGRVRRTGDERRAAQQQWADAEGAALRLRGARLAGIAAELAGELVDGRPCPVCGSADHPAAAQPGEDHVDAELVAAAEERAGAATAHAQHAASQWASAVGRAETTCQAMLDSLDRLTRTPAEDDPDNPVEVVRVDLASAVAPHRARLGVLTTRLDEVPDAGRDNTGALQTVAETLAGALDSITARAEQAGDATRQLDALDRRLEELRADLRAREQLAARAAETARTAIVRQESVQQQATAATERLERLTAEHHQVCGCCRDDGAGHDDAAAHTRALTGLERLTDAAAAARTADGELAAASAELDHVLGDQAFPDVESACAAMLSEEQQHQLRDRVRIAHTERDKATGVLEQPGVAAALDAPPAEVAQVAAELSAAERSARHTHDAVGDLRRAAQTLERTAAELVAHDERSEPVHEQLAVATSLATAVSGSGDNALRMRLTAYVLAARLEAVTAFANERLQVMTAGRYQLEHTDAKAGRGKSGLGLQVRDAWTGTTRDTATLSGGESFLASLALALGLGDAVLHAAGGRRLETLLVDEGFGSLDEDSLEQVLDVLDGLRAGGRSVGIVSHVAELRTRIPAQIRVHKTATGSTLEVRDATHVA